MSKQAYASIQWTIDDVVVNGEQFGIEITRNEAREVLAVHEGHIEDAMVEAGWQVIEDALRYRVGDK